MKLFKLVVAGAVSLMPLAANASLTFDADGTGNGDGAVQADQFDWSPTSFLAQNGTQAILNFQTAAAAGKTCAEAGLSCDFTVYSHATLTSTALTDSTNTSPAGLDTTYEVSAILVFTETVNFISVNPSNGHATASFDLNTSEGILFEMFYDSTPDANALTGFGFNDGDLIMTATGTEASSGSFTVTQNDPLVNLDQAGADDYNLVNSVTGNGSQGNINLTGITIDDRFFLTDVADFSINFANIGQALPFTTVDPSDCFTDDASGLAVAGAGSNDNAGVDCADTASIGGLFSIDTNGGVSPDVGTANGLFIPQVNLGGPDFIAQADFNSSVRGVPAPATLALMGLGLLGLGGFTRRQKG